MSVTIDIVSDFVCPWCFIGKTRLAQAIAQVREQQPQADFQINWLPYFLDPAVPQTGVPYHAYLEAKFGGAQRVAAVHAAIIAAGRESGIELDFARIARRPNTLRAHRLVYRAQSLGHPPQEIEALVDRLFDAHFLRGEDIGDLATLAAIAAECGDRKDAVEAYLGSEADTDKVGTLVGRVGKLGVDGVPFFIIDRRLTVSGAQSGVVLAAAILQATSLAASGQPSP